MDEKFTNMPRRLLPKKQLHLSSVAASDSYCLSLKTALMTKKITMRRKKDEDLLMTNYAFGH